MFCSQLVASCPHDQNTVIAGFSCLKLWRHKPVGRKYYITCRRGSLCGLMEGSKGQRFSVLVLYLSFPVFVGKQPCGTNYQLFQSYSGATHEQRDQWWLVSEISDICYPVITQWFSNIVFSSLFHWNVSFLSHGNPLIQEYRICDTQTCKTKHVHFIMLCNHDVKVCKMCLN